jgi:hypothetical protein
MSYGCNSVAGSHAVVADFALLAVAKGICFSHAALNACPRFLHTLGKCFVECFSALICFFQPFLPMQSVADMFLHTLFEGLSALICFFQSVAGRQSASVQSEVLEGSLDCVFD